MWRGVGKFTRRFGKIDGHYHGNGIGSLGFGDTQADVMTNVNLMYGDFVKDNKYIRKGRDD